ncbi:uncharacterized protein LOC143623327 [Bidens hawaiensis]|uniref:uncharacterized protein LOC143623327 n=1 Tax=Bidens hawaiensis TaxID=980011 RepID=UPI00404B15DC
MTHVGEFSNDLGGGPASDKHFLDRETLEVEMLLELEELQDHTYTHSDCYKQQVKELQDRKLECIEQLKCGDMVLWHNSQLRLFPGKLRSRWSGPFIITKVFPDGTVEIKDKGGTFMVNGDGLMHYTSEPMTDQTVEVFYLDPLSKM